MPIPVMPISRPTSPSEGILKREVSSSSNPCRNIPVWFIFRLLVLYALSLCFYLVVCSFGSAPAQSGGSSASSSSLLTAVGKMFEFDFSSTAARASSPSHSPTRDCSVGGFFFDGIAGSYFVSHRSACFRPSIQCVNVDVKTRNSSNRNACVAVVRATQLAAGATDSFRSHLDLADVLLQSIDPSAGNVRGQKCCRAIPFVGLQSFSSQSHPRVSLERFPLSGEPNSHTFQLPNIERSSTFPETLCSMHGLDVVLFWLLLFVISPFMAYFARAARIPASPSPCRFCAKKCKSMHTWTMRAMLALILSTSPLGARGLFVSANLLINAESHVFYAEPFLCSSSWRGCAMLGKQSVRPGDAVCVCFRLHDALAQCSSRSHTV